MFAIKDIFVLQALTKIQNYAISFNFSRLQANFMEGKKKLALFIAMTLENRSQKGEYRLIEPCKQQGSRIPTVLLYTVNLFTCLLFSLSVIFSIFVFLTCLSSTISSCLSALSAVTWKDILESRLRHLTEGTKALITKSLGAATFPTLF